MSRLTRDGTDEPVSRDQILRRERGQGNIIFIFPVQLATSRISNLTRLILTLASCDFSWLFSFLLFFFMDGREEKQTKTVHRIIDAGASLFFAFAIHC